MYNHIERIVVFACLASLFDMSVIISWRLWSCYVYLDGFLKKQLCLFVVDQFNYCYRLLG